MKKITPILILSIIILIYHINKPFVGQHDWNGAFWGNIARNYTASIHKLFGMNDWMEIDRIHSGKVVYFNHYIPFMPVLFTISSLIFGINETSLRLVTAIFSVLMVYYVYKIGKEIYSEKIGLIAALLMIVTPIFWYYGKLPDHEPILASLCTGTFYYFLKIKEKKNKYTVLFFVFLLMSLLESWASFIFLGVLIFYSLLNKNIKPRLITLLFITGIAVIMFHFCLIYFLTGKDSVIGFLRYGLIRMDYTSVSTMPSFSLIQFFVTEARYGVIYFTRILMLLSSLWIVRITFLLLKRKITNEYSILILLFGIIFIGIFRNLAFIHDYKIILLLPFIAISSAKILWLGISSLIKRLRMVSNIQLFAVILTILILLIGWERSNYTKTILQSSFDKPGYDLGTLINKKSKPTDNILLLSTEFDSFYGVFMRYYANRAIFALDIKNEEFEKNLQVFDKYNFAVIVDNRPIDKKIQQQLLENYPTSKSGNYTFIKLK